MLRNICFPILVIVMGGSIMEGGELYSPEERKWLWNIATQNISVNPGADYPSVSRL